MFQEKTLGPRFEKLFHIMLSRNLDATAVISKLMHLIIHQKERERTVMTTTTHNHSQQRQLPRSRYFVKKKWPFYYKPVEKKSHWLRNERGRERAVFFISLAKRFVSLLLLSRPFWVRWPQQLHQQMQQQQPHHLIANKWLLNGSG